MRKVFLSLSVIAAAFFSSCNKDAEVLELPAVKDYAPQLVNILHTTSTLPFL
jgi:hypothetical protein